MRTAKPEPPDGRPDYFAPANSAEDAVLRRIKGNFRRQMISKSILSDGLASIPEQWCAHDIPEHFKAILTSTAGPRARGGEDLPDLAEGEVEIARLTLVNSVHGEVTSLRAKRNPQDRDILLSMVDEYETEFKLPKSKVSAPLTAEEALAVFRDADPTPLATSCQHEFSSFFYSNLNVAASEMVKKSGEEPPDNDDPLTRAKARAFARVVIANQLGLEADCIRSRSDGHPYLVLKVRETIPQDKRIQDWLTIYHAGVEAEKVLYGSYTGDGSGEIEDLAQEFHLDKNHLLQASQTVTEQRGRNDFIQSDVKKITEELRHRLAWGANNKEAALDDPYLLFFFSAIDHDGVTRFFDAMKQEDGFSLAETATSAPRLGQCVETVYGDPSGGTHHVHRIYGKYRTGAARQAMEKFASRAGLTQVSELAKTSTLREASPTWKIIFEKLGCESLAFSPKSTTDYRTEINHAKSNAVTDARPNTEMLRLKTCPNCRKEVLSLITDNETKKRYCCHCIPNPETCAGAVFVARKMDELHTAGKLETYTVEQRIKDLNEPPRCSVCGAVVDGEICEKCKAEALLLGHRQRRESPLNIRPSTGEDSGFSVRSTIPDLRREESKHLKYWGEPLPLVPPDIDYFPGKGDMDVIPWAYRIHKDAASCDRVDWVVRAEGEKIAREHYIGTYNVPTPQLTKEKLEEVYEHKRHPRRILVVHHERLIGDLICGLLQQDGYEARMESSSADAIRTTGNFVPQLLIIDPVMPEISGLDAAKDIFDQTQCKVLLVSAGASDSGFRQIIGDLRSLGCDCAALGLPFEKEHLLELVRAQILSEKVARDDIDVAVPEADSPESMIDFANMTPVMPDADLLEGFVRVIMPDGKCFDILEELWTKARQIEAGCVIMSLKATGKKQN